MLHARPWSETSLLIDVFTEAHGRFRLLAKGARRKKTGQRGVLQAFQPLIISWAGKRGIPVLTQVEQRGIWPRLRSEALASAYYMSELLFKFLHANDPHEQLFDAYGLALEDLADNKEIQCILRNFECTLLGEIGYGLLLTQDVNSHQSIAEDARYHYYPERGPVQVHDFTEASDLIVSGKTLLALENRDFNNVGVKKESKKLLRALLGRQLLGKTFTTRAVYAQMLKTA